MPIDRRLSLEHFRAFVAVVECGSFAAAAQRLLRTQSALTHQIQRMEEILGERLLLRSRGHYGGLTEEGARFLPRAVGVLAMVEGACDSVGRAALVGRVRIGIMDDFDIRWLIELIGRFEGLYPGVETCTVSDLSGHLGARLARGEIDVAVTKRLFDPANGPARALSVERLSWVTSVTAGWDGEGPVPLVLFHEGCVYRQRVFDTLARRGIGWRIAYAGHSYANVRAAVAAGLGVAALPEGQIGLGVRVWTGVGGLDLPELGHVELTVRAAGEAPNPVVAAFVAELERELGAPSRDAGGSERVVPREIAWAKRVVGLHLP